MTGIATPPWVVPGPKLMPGARLIADPVFKVMLVGLVTVHPRAPQRWKAPQFTADASTSLTDIWAWTGPAGAPASSRAAVATNRCFLMRTPSTSRARWTAGRSLILARRTGRAIRLKSGALPLKTLERADRAEIAGAKRAGLSPGALLAYGHVHRDHQRSRPGAPAPPWRGAGGRTPAAERPGVRSQRGSPPRPDRPFR